MHSNEIMGQGIMLTLIFDIQLQFLSSQYVIYLNFILFKETRLEKARSESICESLQQKVDLAEDKAFQLMDKLEVIE